MKKFGLRLTGCRKYYFLIFTFFSFFQISNKQKSYAKTILFYKGFWGSTTMKIYYVKNIFDLHTFDNETTALIKFFEISREMYFVSLFFLNERNISISILMYYANLNSNSINKPYLRAAECALSFVFFSIYLWLFKFVKTL